MKNSNIHELIRQADQELEKAVKELNHPAEDVVSYSACVFSRKALYRYMKSLYIYYAGKNEDPVEEDLSLEEMVEYCRPFNEEIDTMDLSEMNCKVKDLSEDSDELYYCEDVQKVNGCMHMAQRAQKIASNMNLNV